MRATQTVRFTGATVIAGLSILLGHGIAQAEAPDNTNSRAAKIKGLSKATSPKVKKACKPSKSKLGVSRTITLDSKGGPKFGFVNYSGNEILKDKEVLLTFDDGPLPRYTNTILKALEQECTRATFFAVGRMSIAFPKTVKRIMAEGHTLGTHTWSHGNLQRHGSKGAISQIERGFAAVEAAAGRPIAPIFRFPYLGRTKAMEAHLAKRNISVWSIDIDSRDTRGYSARRIVSHTMSRLKSRGKGIVLFHDIKRTTAAAIVPFLRALRKNGFKIVHLKSSSYAPPVASLKKKFDKLLAARASGDRKQIKIAQKALGSLPSRNTRSLKRRTRGSIKVNSAITTKKPAKKLKVRDPFTVKN